MAPLLCLRIPHGQENSCYHNCAVARRRKLGHSNEGKPSRWEHHTRSTFRGARPLPGRTKILTGFFTRIPSRSICTGAGCGRSCARTMVEYHILTAWSGDLWPNMELCPKTRLLLAATTEPLLPGNQNLQLGARGCTALRWRVCHENQNQEMPCLAHHASGSYPA